jgi:hypothetical protein
VLAGSDADPALPLGVRQLLVSDLVLCDALARGVDDTGAHGNTVPVPIGISKFCRYSAVQRLRGDRLGDAELDCLLQTRNIDGENDVGRGVLALGADPLLKPVLGEDHVDGNPCLARELVKQRLDEAWLAIGVDVHASLGIGRLEGAETYGN